MPINLLASLWSASGASPVGSRHLTTHASFVKLLDLENTCRFDPVLDYASFGTGITATRVFTMIPSGVMTGKEVQSLKLWNSLPISGIQFYYDASGTWTQGKIISTGNTIMPSSLPTAANIKRQDDVSGMLGGSGDSDATQFIYMACFCSGNLSPVIYVPQIKISYLVFE